MFAAGCLPSLVDGEVTSPELDVFGMGEPRALMGCASFSLSFNFGSQYESPSLPHATLSFAVGEVLVALKLEAGRRVDLRDLAVLAGTDLDGERVATPRDRSMTRATRHAALRRELPSTADPGRRDRTGGGRDKGRRPPETFHAEVHVRKVEPTREDRAAMRGVGEMPP